MKYKLERSEHSVYSLAYHLVVVIKYLRKALHFKGSGWYNTLNYNQSGFKIDQDHGLLHLSKIGEMRIKLYRKIEGCIKAVIIKNKRINCQRDDFLHKLSRLYVNNFDIICVEDIDVKGLKEKGHNTGMHRSIHDASWSKFIFMLSYEAQSAGRRLIKVDPRNKTQM